ncbi:MAG: hypothetical protein JWN43_3422 [Gammaproteobacteria bacterium]|nr:hypothetical protein [Gammaproteobacteria bacterium]
MAAFEWPIGKLELINSSLSQTGDSLVATADDGSVEWNTCSPAYERGLAYVSEAHPWSWLTDFRVLQPSPTPPNDDRYDTAYILPPDLVHLILVRVNDGPCVWDLLNGQLVVNAKGGPPPPSVPTTPFAVTIKGIFSTDSDPVFATPTVVVVLQMFVMSGIYRGMKKDVAEANSLWSAAHKMLGEAKARHDMQLPKRAIFRSRMTQSRRHRRPGSPTVRGLGGSGWPGE